MNSAVIKLPSIQVKPRPEVGLIYRDKSDRSFVVLAVHANEAITEYADGDVTSIPLKDWKRLEAKPALF